MSIASIASRRVRRPAENTGGRDRVILIDPQKLRQAGFESLLEEWAEKNGLLVLAISTPEELNRAADCAIIILSVGGLSVLQEGPQLWIKIARNILSHVPLVILSDREDPTEIRAAFEEGARGFIATNLEPSVALEALNFLRRGGSFFPLSAIQCEAQPPAALRRAWDAPSIAGRAVVRVRARLGRSQEPEQTNGGQVAAPLRSAFPLTPRQLEVLERLREGKPNKLIARDLQMTEATVKVHVRQIMRKLGAANRTQAVLCAVGIASGGNGGRSG
jgi:DNA-binding NarL/FixJ family response regulator